MEKRQANGPTAVNRPARQVPDDSDHGLVALREATTAFVHLREELLEERATSAELSRRVAELHDTVASLESRNEALKQREAALGERVDALHAEARVAEERAARLLASVREMHRALYHGTTWEHVLQASINLTEAERGYYVADERGGLRIRAAMDVPAKAGDAPSPFIAGIAKRVLETGEAVRWAGDAAPDGLQPADDERFNAGVAVPVTIRGGACGVIIALDRDPEFRDSEVQSLLSVGTEAGVAVENARLRLEVQRAYTATIAMLADTVSAKDPYTQGHCEQVSQYARLAADRLELSPDEKRIACYAALLHDVGKIGVSDGVLNKPGPLIAEERKLVEAHVRIGHDLLVGIPVLRDVAAAVLYHHEWWDGSGYPEGRAGEDIPIASRIVSVVDAYCAMLDRRSYKEAFTAEQARAELRRCAGTQFDPRIVDVVLVAIEQADAAQAVDPSSPDAQSGCGILPGMVAPRP